jgi:uncharacterized protein YkwD
MVLVPKKQPGLPVHHRKRQGQHHKKDDGYHKPYWPYLPLLGIAGVGFFLNILWAPFSQAILSNNNFGSVLSFATNTSSADLLTETNAQRASNGASGLALNSQLNNAAQAKANDMATKNYWSHETPDGTQPWQFITQAGYSYTTAGENLAYGFDSSATTITGWMNSPGHKANLINNAFHDVGFGIANAEDYQGHGQQTIVVAMYGATTAAAAPVAASAPTAKRPQQVSTPVAAPAATAPNSTTTSTPTTATPDAAKASQPTGNPNQVSVGATAPDQPKRVTRMELAANTLPTWSLAATLSIVIACAFWFLSRHLRALHRMVVHGESFVIHHAALDIVIISIITVGVLLTRTAGFIN